MFFNAAEIEPAWRMNMLHRGRLSPPCSIMTGRIIYSDSATLRTRTTRRPYRYSGKHIIFSHVENILKTF